MMMMVMMTMMMMMMMMMMMVVMVMMMKSIRSMINRDDDNDCRVHKSQRDAAQCDLIILCCRLFLTHPIASQSDDGPHE